MLSSFCFYCLTCFSFFLSLFNPVTSLINKISEEDEYIEKYEYRLNEDIQVSVNNENESISMSFSYKNRLLYKTLVKNLEEAELLKDNVIIQEDRIVIVRSIDAKIVFINALFNGEIINNELEEKSDRVNTICIDNDYYVFSTYKGVLSSYIINNNGIINSKTYEINEGKKVSVKKVVNNNDYIHLVLEKDLLAGGVFGNGGNTDNGKGIILYSIDKELKRIDVKSFNEPAFNNIEVKDNKLYLSMDKSLYCYDENLNKIYGLSFSNDSIYCKTYINYYGLTFYARFFKNGLEVWNIDEQKRIYDKEYSYIDKIIEVDDKYVALKYIDNRYVFLNDINLYDISLFIEENDYNDNNDKPNNINEYIYSFNKKINRTLVKTIGGFNSNEQGNYITYYSYGDLELTSVTHVYPTVNVRDNVTYPLHYKLEFNTKGLLNGYEIYNNYSIDRVGSYKLELLIDDKIFKTINFYVSDKYKINSDDNSYLIRNYDYYVKDGETLKLEYKMPKIDEISEKDVKIEEIWVNNAKFGDFESFKSSSGELVIYLYLRGLKRGNNEFLVSFIKTSEGIYEINDNLSVFVLDNEPDNVIHCNVKNKKIDFDLSITDIDNTIKYFYVDYYNGNNLVRSDAIDIVNQEYIIDKRIAFSKIVIGEAYDIKENTLIDNDLLEISYNDINNKDRISFEVLNRENSINEVRISVNKTNNIKKVNLLNSNNDNVYVGSNYNYLVIILSCAIVLAVGLLIAILIIRKYYGLSFIKNKILRNK